MPWVHDVLDRWPPLMGAVVAGPALVALGAALDSRRLTTAGTVGAAATAAVMAHMARQPVVPGANDNLTGVAALLEIARRVAGRAPDGLRLILLVHRLGGGQPGRHARVRPAALRPPGSAEHDVPVPRHVGSPELVLIEGEGFLRMRDYDAPDEGLVADAAAARGRPRAPRAWLHVRARTRSSPCGAGTASHASFGEHWLVPSNYHWPTDTAENVDYDTVAAAVEIVLEAADRPHRPRLRRTPPPDPRS